VRNVEDRQLLDQLGMAHRGHVCDGGTPVVPGKVGTLHTEVANQPGDILR